MYAFSKIGLINIGRFLAVSEIRYSFLLSNLF